MSNNLTSEDSSEDVSGVNTLIKLEPAELMFQKVLVDQPETKTLKLINTSESFLAFKVKTTAPKRYCVRPNTGFLQPHEQVEVSVILNLQKDPPKSMDPSIRQRDKFQIQSVAVKGPTDESATKAVWESATRETLMRQKLRSYFTIAPQKKSGEKKKDDAIGTSDESSSSQPTLTRRTSSAVAASTPAPATTTSTLDELAKLQDKISQLEGELKRKTVAITKPASPSKESSTPMPTVLLILLAFIVGIILSKLLL